MSMFARPPAAQTLPTGVEIARFARYPEAQKAVDRLADRNFAVANVTIVGRDLMSVERVLAKLTWGKVALAGLMSGAWFGLFVGLLMGLFTASDRTMVTIVVGVLVGAGFGMLFGLASYAMTRGQRDFASQTAVVAQYYSVLCSAEVAAQARQILQEAGLSYGMGEQMRTPAPAAGLGTQPGAGNVPGAPQAPGEETGDGADQEVTARHDYEPDRPNPFRAP